MKTVDAVPVAIVGASGYTGGELLRLLAVHPHARVVGLYAKQSAGESLADLFPQFTDRIRLDIHPFDAAEIARTAKVVFTALPHGESAPLVAELYAMGLTVIDLSADFRLRNAVTHKTWYGHDAHPLRARALYGLPELSGHEFVGQRLFAVPGCYPTATLLALSPLIEANLIERQGLIVDAKSGVSGAGRAPSRQVHFVEAAGGVRAYGVAGTHRHIPEIEEQLGVQGLVFTPHLVPMARGILVTCYGIPTDATRPLSIYREALAARYNRRPFVTVVDAPPDTSTVRGSNRAFVFVTLDARAGRLIVMCALDNLTKGASGQAIQCMNLALGFAETAGLDGVGWLA